MQPQAIIQGEPWHASLMKQYQGVNDLALKLYRNNLLTFFEKNGASTFYLFFIFYFELISIFANEINDEIFIKTKKIDKKIKKFKNVIQIFEFDDANFFEIMLRYQILFNNLFFVLFVFFVNVIHFIVLGNDFGEVNFFVVERNFWRQFIDVVFLTLLKIKNLLTLILLRKLLLLTKIRNLLIKFLTINLLNRNVILNVRFFVYFFEKFLQICCFFEFRYIATK